MTAQHPVFEAGTFSPLAPTDAPAPASQPGQLVRRLWPAGTDHQLPAILTWNAKLHGGAERLEVIFDAAPGGYLLELAVVEQHRRRIRPGPNLQWDGPQKSRGDRVYDLQDEVLKRWLTEIEAQIDSPAPHRGDLDFWTVDEHANQPMSALCTVHLDGREVAVFAEHFPRHTLDGEDGYRLRRLAVALVVESAGLHQLTVVPHHEVDERNPSSIWGRYNSARLQVNGIRVSPQPARLPPHPLRQGRPRPYPLDFWGWEAPLFYQRYAAKGASLAYFRRLFRECFHRGANFVDVYLTDCNRTVCPGYAGVVPWPDRLNIPGKESYQHNATTQWSTTNLKKLNRAAHANGLMISWYSHVPHFPNHYVVPADWFMAYVRVILEQFGRLGATTPADRIDGLLFETAGFATNVDLLLLNETLGARHPSAFFCESEDLAMRTTSGLVPARLGYFTCIGRAREDKDPNLQLLDPRWSESRFGETTHFGQLNCRDRKYSAIYGDTGRDAIIKQVNDFVRRRGPDAEAIGRASGVEWLGEPREVTSDQARQTVYAASADPGAAALAAPMETYGVDGWYDQAQQRREPFWFRRRYDSVVSHHDHFVQNSYLRAYIAADREGGPLVLDTSATAHYDSDAPKLTLSDSLVSTVAEGSVRLDKKHVAIDQIGPYQAQVTESLAYSTNIPAGASLDQQARVHETRRYACISDLPMLHLELERRFEAAQPVMATALALPGYDQLTQGRRRWRGDGQAETRPFDPTPLVLRDRSGLRPPLAVIIGAPGRRPDQVRWRAGQGLSFWWHNARAHPFGVGARQVHPVADDAQTLSIDLVVLGPLYTLKDVPHLTSLWRSTSARSGSDQGVRRLSNRSTLPVVKLMSLPRHQAKPVLVEEDGWWRFRGVQPTADGRDLVKVYLPPDRTARIMRWGYIAGVARPGPGSQYLVELGQVVKMRGGAWFQARVRGQTPAVSPAVDLVQPIHAVAVDGQPWLHFEGSRLCLPKAAGEYRMEVRFGTAEVPHVVATHAVLSRMRWDGRSLTFRAGLPAYSRALPPSVHLYAAVDANRAGPCHLTGAEAVNRHGNMHTIRFKPGRIKMTWSEEEA